MKKQEYVGLFFAPVFAIAMLLFCSLQAAGQSTPPMMVQVPFINVAAGNIGSGSSSATHAASCTTSLASTGGSSIDGDGCLASQIGITTGSSMGVYGAAADKWGNIYFGQNDSIAYGDIRVIYAGGASNPAAAMIAAANPTHSGLTPTAGYVYALAGGYQAALTGSAAPYYCNNQGSGTQALTSNGSGCPATQSYLKRAYGPAVDGDGNVFIIDESNSLVYVVLASATDLAAQLVVVENPGVTPQIGSIYLIGSKAGGYIDGILAINGEVKAPFGIAVDASENVYIADSTNSSIRMINGPNTTIGANGPGYIHTIAGSCTSTACTALSGAPAANTAALGAKFVTPMGIAVDGYGNIYVGDNSSAAASTPSSVRVIYAGGANNPVASLICLESSITNCSASSLTAGYVYTLAGYQNAGTGSGATGNGGLATASAVKFEKIQGIALDSHGNIYIADYASKGLVTEVNAATGNLTFVAGAAATSALAAGNNCVTGSTASSGPTMVDGYGDGCPATESNEDHIEGNLAVDSAGNIYFADNGYGLIRKLTFNGFAAGTVGGAGSTQTLAFSLLTGATSYLASNVSVSVLTQGKQNGDFVDVGGANDTCTGATTLNGFTTASTGSASSSSMITTCVVPITFTPTKAGARSGAVQIQATLNGSTVNMTPAYLSGTGMSPEAVIDPVQAAATLGAGTAPQGVAVDGASNVYIAWANGNLSSTPAGTLTTPLVGVTSNPHQVAIDGAGNLFVADTGNNRIVEYVAGAASVTPIVTGLNAPQGVAVDAAGNLYIADTGNERVLMQPIGGGLLKTLGSGFTAPQALALDANGNLYVADAGAGKIVTIMPATGSQNTVLSGIAPIGLAIDAAGDIVYLDSSLNQAIEVPIGGAAEILAQGFVTPKALALDANGGLYAVDAANSGVSWYSRTATAANLTNQSPLAGVVVTNIGNVSFSGAVTQTDSSDFTLGPAASNGCNSASSLTIAVGQNCGLTALFTPVATGNLSDSVSIANAIPGALTMSLTGYNAAPVAGTSISLGSLAPGSPAYGQTVQVTATVTATSGTDTPTGTVSITVDGGAASAPQTLSASGTSTFSLPSLGAGPHSVTAAYTPTGNFSGSSTATAFSFSVTALAISATANTPVNAIYGQAIPAITGSLNGVLAADTANVTPAFSTTATSTSPVGNYPIGVSLSGSAAGNYTVTLNGSPVMAVAPAAVNVTIASVSKTYGNANPAFSGTFTGVLAADAANVSANFATTATAASSAGTYTISATALTGTAAGNYTLGTVTAGTLTVSPLGITATANPVSAMYAQPIPAITGSLTGVLAADQNSVSVAFGTTATAASPVGSYPITIASVSGSAAGNYSVTLTGTPAVTIGPATVTVTVNNATRAYGAANPTFGGTLSGVATQDTANVAAAYSTTATVTSSVNTYPITAKSLSGSAATNYTLGTVTPGTLTITQAGTSTSLIASTPSVGEGSAVTFTATVTSQTSGTPTGSVVFSSGGATLGSVTLVAGVAAYSTSALPVGVQSITAAYNGSTNFSGSTSGSVNETVTVPIATTTVSSSTVTLQNGSGTVTLNVTAAGGYTGTATYSCALLPADMTCSFSPATSTFTSAATTATVTLTIATNGSTGSTALLTQPDRRGGDRRLPLAAGFLLPGLLAGVFGFRKGRQLWKRCLLLAIFAIAGVGAIAGVSGCGGSAGATKTPAGTYNIEVEVTAGTVQTIPLTVVVQ